MTDWNNPTLSTAYATFLSTLKDRDFDAASLFLNAPTNPTTGMMRYVRASNKFQEWDGAAWQDKNLSVAGGGTGAATAANARTNLGLGTIATQDANNVAITGGAIDGVPLDATDLVGAVPAASLANAMPTGAMLIWPAGAAPTGFLLAQGQSLDRGTYAALFAVIGTVYGAVDGTHFNIPDAQQRFPLGKAAAGTGSALAGTGGAIDHTHTGPSHTHTGPSHTHPYTDVVNHTHPVNITDPGHDHPMGSSVNVGGLEPIVDLNGIDPANTNPRSGSSTTGITATTSNPAGGVATGTTQAGGTGATGASGTGATGTANPPYFVINYIIKT